MAYYIVFKAVLVGVLLGGLIFAIASMRKVPIQGSNSINLGNQGVATNKTISAIQTFIKFILGCLIVMLLIAVPFIILKIVL
jgi:hypothetical protein